MHQVLAAVQAALPFGPEEPGDGWCLTFWRPRQWIGAQNHELLQPPCPLLFFLEKQPAYRRALVETENLSTNHQVCRMAYTSYNKLRGLTNNPNIFSLQFWRANAQNGSHWDKTKVRAGLCSFGSSVGDSLWGRIRFIACPTVWGPPHSSAHGLPSPQKLLPSSHLLPWLFFLCLSW